MREPEKTIVFCKQLQDGKLSPTAGRVVIYQNFVDISNGPSRVQTEQRYVLRKKRLL